MAPFAWQPGEHVAVAGQTGSGKSTLVAMGLLPMRRYTLVLRTKPDKVKYEGHRVVRRAKEMDAPAGSDKIVLAPAYARQQEEIALALERVWTQGGWTVYVDELFYVTSMLGLAKFIERLLTQGRSKGISVIVGMQRPVHVTRFAISEATHVLTFFLEGRDTKTMAEAASPTIAELGPTLRRHEFAWYYRPERASSNARDYLWRGFAQDLGVAIK